MEKKGLLGKVFYLGLVFSIMTSMLIMGFTEAAEMIGAKANDNGRANITAAIRGRSQNR